MHAFFRSLFLVVTTLLAASLAQAAPPLVTPAELPALLAGGARVVDLRDGAAYAKQHVPGSVSAPYARWRGPASNPGLLPPYEHLTTLVQQLGLEPDTRTVLVYAGTDSTDFGAAARVYWTLKSLGVRELSILNGGLTAWRAAGLPLDAAPMQVARSRWQPSFDPRWLATREDVRDALGRPDVVLVDARPEGFYLGQQAHPAAKAPGTLPGAHNLDNDQYFDDDSATLMSKAKLAAEAQGVPVQPGQTVVSFCNTGHWGATDWFVRSEMLGQPNARLYAGSLVDWTQSSTSLPLANEPGRAEQLRRMVRRWTERNLGGATQ